MAPSRRVLLVAFLCILKIIIIQASSIDIAQVKELGIPHVHDVSKKLMEFELNEVALIEGSPEFAGQRLNMKYLHLLPVEDLMWTFQKNANLTTTGKPLGGWESPSSQIRGHFVSMYISASAKAYRTYGDLVQKQKADAMVSILKQCQEALNESGYLSAFPSVYFDWLEEWRQPVPWAPYYVIQKICTALFDMHTMTGNQEAWPILTKLVDYFYNRMQNLVKVHTIARWQQMLAYLPATESGGFNQFMYILYDVTRDPRHLWMAQMFDDGSFLGPLELNQDWLTNVHANSHIPLVLGAAKRYEIFQESDRYSIVSNFWRIVTANHSYATGGSNGGNGSSGATDEHWGWPGRLSLTLTNNNQEFCTQYNMLKVARYLITWRGEVEHVDFYERAYLNGILGTQNSVAGPGVMLYNYPLAAGFTKGQSLMGWGSINGSFWCCYATAVEQWANMADSVYFQSPDHSAVYVNLFVPTTLTWTIRNISITQKNNFPAEEGTTLIVDTGRQASAQFVMHIRVPYWIGLGGNITVNGHVQHVPLMPSSWASLDRVWKTGDVVHFSMPMYLHTHVMPDNDRMFAIMWGPIVLAGITKTERTLAITSTEDVAKVVHPVRNSDNAIRFSADTIDSNGKTSQMAMLPLYEVIEQNYGVYWLLANKV